MRLLVQHRSHYRYDRPAALGPHVVRLRPAAHTKAKIESYQLRIEQPCELRWQQDPAGNHIARLSFASGSRFDRLDVIVELAVSVDPVNPFDFFLDQRAEKMPFAYPDELRHELRPYLDADDEPVRGGPLLERLLGELPEAGNTVDLVVAFNRAVNQRIRYVIREESGIYTPEQTLAVGHGSCRDSALLLVALLRRRGLAARFVSGYLIQLTDEGLLPDVPRGVSRDVVDLHAWAEVYLPGAGWIGLDATSGLLAGEGHIPLCCTARPELAAPITGTSDLAAAEVRFHMAVARLGHEPRPTAPYTDEVWQSLLGAGEAIDARLDAAQVTLTMGGEPTFNSREQPEAPEWNGAALGPSKWSQGLRLASELQARLCPGGVLLLRQGKWYPGESLPRWALELIGRRDGQPIWSGPLMVAPSDDDARADARAEADAALYARRLAARLGLGDYLQPAYEDPWRFLQDEASLPVDVDPLAADLDDPEERRRLARVLDRGLGRPVGWVLPLEPVYDHAPPDHGNGHPAHGHGQPGDGRGRPARLRWRSERWQFRRGHIFLVPGDNPIGLRLPLRSLSPAPPRPVADVVLPPGVPRDPRWPVEDADGDGGQARLVRARPEDGHVHAGAAGAVRTALCVEARGGVVHVFLPPLSSAAEFLALVAEVDAARADEADPAQRLGVMLEGYAPPPDPSLLRFAVTPDPGVLEVNLPPTARLAAYVPLMESVFDAALHAGLHCEKYLLDGRQAGSGGGHHLTLGGPSPLESVFVRRPDVLASLLTFLQHHPSLSYLFAGLFVGPTSQAPRVDEARHDALYELELALERAFAGTSDPGSPPPPWMTDLLFRHLLVDVAGNTHRTEVCIDKLFDPQTPSGRQGLIELRAFEMPPHVRMAVAQMVLVRALVASFASEPGGPGRRAGGPYRAPLVRWGLALHDRFLLPYYLWRDLRDVLAYLADAGLPLPDEAYRPFVELRCPLVGTLQAGDVTLEVRNALEPWNVLGEEVTAAGTSRYVDSSMERIEVRVRGLVPERHQVLCNGHVLPLHPTATAGEHVAGVRFRAWAPPHSLHPHIGIHHPIRLDVVDTWGRRSLGSCAYHVWHPEGRAFDAPPLTRFEAAARRAQRFTVGPSTSGSGELPSGPYLFPVQGRPATAHPEAPVTLDLRRLPLDRPMPVPQEEASPDAAAVAPSPGDGARPEPSAPGSARASSALSAR